MQGKAYRHSCSKTACYNICRLQLTAKFVHLDIFGYKRSPIVYSKLVKLANLNTKVLRSSSKQQCELEVGGVMANSGMQTSLGQAGVAESPCVLGAAQGSGPKRHSNVEVGSGEHHGSLMSSKALMNMGRVGLLLRNWVVHTSLQR